MSTYTDGKKTVEIIMRSWEGGQWSPSWEEDFFENGGLEYDEERDAYIVPDVDYLIEQALDDKYSIGDYTANWDDEREGVTRTPEGRGVWVDDEWMTDDARLALWEAERIRQGRNEEGEV